MNEIIQIYIVEAKRLYIKNCIENGINPDKEILEKFDKIVKQESKNKEMIYEKL